MLELLRPYNVFNGCCERTLMSFCASVPTNESLMAYTWNVYSPAPGGAWNDMRIVRTELGPMSVNL